MTGLEWLIAIAFICVSVIIIGIAWAEAYEKRGKR